MSETKKGRPFQYPPEKPRRQRGITLSDELWQVLQQVAGEKRCSSYIEEQLRKLPEVALILVTKKERDT